MGLQQFERRLERMVEGVFARAFRSGLQPVEIGRRLTREMDLRRTVAPKGTLTPNHFTVVSCRPEDRDRFAPIEDELVGELISVARDHARSEGYIFLGPVDRRDRDRRRPLPGDAAGLRRDGRRTADDHRRRQAPHRRRGPTARATLVLPDGRRLVLGRRAWSSAASPSATSCWPTQRQPAPRRGPPGGQTGRLRGRRPGQHQRDQGQRGRGRRPQVLRDGDEITVGATSLRFEQG